MIRHVLSACIALSIFVGASAARAEMQVGAAVKVFTPNPLLPVTGGIGPGSPAKEKKGELTARAIVFRNGETTVGIVALDVIGFPGVLCKRVSEKVPRIPANNILIGSTHTHSAPDCYAFAMPYLKDGHTGDLKFIDSVCVKAAEALNEAIDNLKPAGIKINTGEAKGKIAYNYYAPELYDRRMSVIQAIGADKKVIATLVNYAVHPEVLGNSVGLCSPDLVGPLCDKLEAETGGKAIFMNGAQGGMITADNRNLDQPPSDPAKGKFKDSRTWEECLRIGNLMADEALRIIKLASVQKDAPLHCEHSEVKFPVDNKALWELTAKSPLNYARNPDHSMTTRINLVNLGNAQILTIPGEALPNIGFYLKRNMKGQHNLLFGLTNDAFGYILTKVDFMSFPRYEYVSKTSLGEMTGEILIDSSLQLVEHAPRPEGAK